MKTLHEICIILSGISILATLGAAGAENILLCIVCFILSVIALAGAQALEIEMNFDDLKVIYSEKENEIRKGA